MGAQTRTIVKRVCLGGQAGAEVSQCCLGTMTWGVQNSEADAHAQLDWFVANGGNFVDTAELYPVPPAADVIGRTEDYIGNWIGASPDRRAKLFLASKVAGPRAGGWIRANRKPEYAGREEDPDFATALTAEQIAEACDASLRRLQTTYLDLYQLHWPERITPCFGKSMFEPNSDHLTCPGKTEFAPFEEQVRAVGDLIEHGKVKYWGLSNETSYGVMMFCLTADRLGVPRPVSVQNDFSIAERRFEMELAEVCYYFNVSLLVYGALCGGSLSGKYVPGFEGATQAIKSRDAAEARHTKFPAFQPRYVGPATREKTIEYCALAKAAGMAPATLALAFCVSRSYIKNSGCVIVGATSIEQLQENTQSLNVELDEATLTAIDRVHRANPNPNADQHLSETTEA